MNHSTWKRAADFIAQQAHTNQQPQAAATLDTNQLQSLLISALSIDDSGSPQVTQGCETPLASSTPRATATLNTDSVYGPLSPDTSRYDITSIPHSYGQQFIKHICLTR